MSAKKVLGNPTLKPPDSDSLPPGAIELLPYIKFHTYLMQLLGANFISWDKKNGKFAPAGFSSSKRFVIMHLCVTIYMITVLVRLANYLKASEEPWIKSIVSFLLLYGTVVGWANGTSAGLVAKEIVKLLNSLIMVDEKDHQNRQKEKWNLERLKRNNRMAIADALRGRYARIIFLAAGSGISCWILFIAVFLTLEPCKLPIFWRSTLPDCQPNQDSQLTPPPLLTVVMDTWFIAYVYSQVYFHIPVSFFAGICCVGRFLEKFQGSPHVINYRMAQLLERQLNIVNRVGNIPTIMLEAFGLSIMSLFVLIKLHSDVPLPILLLAIVIFVDAGFCAQIVMYKVASNINTQSTDWIEEWKRHGLTEKSKLVRRQLWSCYPLKVQIGRSNNYFDKTTPFVVSDMTVNQTVSVLLIADEN